MKQPNDPFEVAFAEQQEQEESPPPPPPPPDDFPIATANVVEEDDDDDDDDDVDTNILPTEAAATVSVSVRAAIPTRTSRTKEEEEDDDEDVVEELGNFPSSGDPESDKMANMQGIISQFTEEQMSRYESFRRSGFQKANMKRLLTSITGSAKISVPITIVVSGIAKMFVGELVETVDFAARIVMVERKESGPIRPCHIREAYRRLKLEGKVPKRSVPRLI